MRGIVDRDPGCRDGCSGGVGRGGGRQRVGRPTGSLDSTRRSRPARFRRRSSSRSMRPASTARRPRRSLPGPSPIARSPTRSLERYLSPSRSAEPRGGLAGAMTTRFDVVGIVVADMARSLAFYRELGFDLPASDDSEPHVEGGPPRGRPHRLGHGRDDLVVRSLVDAAIRRLANWARVRMRQPGRRGRDVRAALSPRDLRATSNRGTRSGGCATRSSTIPTATASTSSRRFRAAADRSSAVDDDGSERDRRGCRRRRRRCRLQLVDARP